MECCFNAICLTDLMNMSEEYHISSDNDHVIWQ